MFIRANTCDIFQLYSFGIWIKRSNTSSIRKIKHKLTGIERVAKIYHRNTENDKKAMVEINTLKKLDHPNIVKLYEYFMDNMFVYIVLEKIEGETLYSYILNNPEASTNNFPLIFKQILQGVEHCHSQGIIHRNITSDNIIVCKNDSKACIVKIIDFSQIFVMPQKITNNRNLVRNSLIKTKESKKLIGDAIADNIKAKEIGN